MFIDYGDLRLPVSVDEQDGQGKAVPPEERRRLADMLDKIAKEPGALIRAVERPAKADWWIRWQAGKVFLVPDAEWSRKEAAGKGVDGLLGPVEAGEKLGGWLKDSLGKIARAENLKRLASNPGEEIARGTGDLDAKVTVEVLRRRDETDKKGQAVEWPAGGRPAFYDGDLLTIRLSNPGRIPVDVTLLYVDSGFGIDALFPSKDKGELNRLEAGDCVRIDLDVEASTAGLENLVVIAVKGEGQPADFVSLAQPTIALAEKDVTKRGIDAARGLNSPLGRLLQNALYGEGGTRAVKRPKGNTDHLIKRLSWQIEPVKRPVEDK